MNFSDLELAGMMADALFVHDDNGRLVSINESEPYGPAARFFLARTKAGNIWRTRYDLREDIASEIERQAASEPVMDDLAEQPRFANEYRELLSRQGAVTDSYIGPAFYLPELDPPDRAVMITRENAGLLQANFPYTQRKLAERSPVAVVVEDRSAVAACFSARITPLVAEAGVYTLEPYWGRGYAVDVVRGWAREIRKMERLPFYSTGWENTASQAVARELGAVKYGVHFSLT